MPNNPNNNVRYLHDLTQQRFGEIEITTKSNKIHKGKFVNLTVYDGNGLYTYYPVNSYCFLLTEDIRKFFDYYNANGGVFPEFPSYVLQLPISEITQIVMRGEAM